MWRRGFSSSAAARADLATKKWDAVVVGGGHNGLTAAAYLARSGLSVAVLERRHLVGGAAITEEVIPGFKFSRCSYLQSLLRPSIIKDLDLPRHGMKLLKRNPSSFTPCLDGRYLLLGPNSALNHSEISKFSKRDAEAYPRYENQLEKFCKLMESVLDSPPPESLRGGQWFAESLRDKMEKSAFWARILMQARSFKQEDIVDLMDLLASPASKVLNNWFEVDKASYFFLIGIFNSALFRICLLELQLVYSIQNLSSLASLVSCPSVSLEKLDFVELDDLNKNHILSVSDVLKATLATDAVIGSTASVHTQGSGYVLLHHMMGGTDGDRGIWSYVEGGMGSVSLALNNAAREAGAHIVTGAQIVQLSISGDSDAVNGVLLDDGTLVNSSVVLSNATPHRTFMELLPQNVLPEEFYRGIKNSDYSSATTKINVAVDGLPQFRCCEPLHGAGPQHVGTIHIGSEKYVTVSIPLSPYANIKRRIDGNRKDLSVYNCMEDIHVACRDAWNGLPSDRPLIEMTIPSVLDKTISPPGKHVINLFIQYTPYQPSGGTWEDAQFRESFAQRCFSLIDEYAPGFSSSIIGYDMLTPPDLEREFGLTGGNIFHGAMGLDSLFLMRPIKGWSGYKTPLRGLYLCGGGAHPGGGVMGAPGRNAAHVVLEDMKRSSGRISTHSKQ
ncbi:hypothetical protein Sjap_016914 [Stephania japonica]|uniref:Uncharacterized protein n=1 Tax=Stephania japonica TaxID=461633 RepID=A0AAP0I562_9MAGN